MVCDVALTVPVEAHRSWLTGRVDGLFKFSCLANLLRFATGGFGPVVLFFGLLFFLFLIF
jgi:hypothetical protein